MGLFYPLAWALLITWSGSPEPKLRNRLKVPTPFTLTADVWGFVSRISYTYGKSKV